MLCKLEKTSTVLLSRCDDTSCLSIPDMFSLFMDLATEHAPMYGLGSDVLTPKGLFWVAVRTKIKIISRPKMMDKITEQTWPEAPGKVRCIRYYSILHDGKSAVEGKTEWAIVDIASGRPRRLSEIYPEDAEHIPDTVCDEPFTAISTDFDGCETLATYTVRSTDIDLGKHMNNSAYINALFGMFSCDELSDMNIKGIEINYRTPCYEGDTITVLKRGCSDGYEFGFILPGGKLAATARFFI